MNPKALRGACWAQPPKPQARALELYFHIFGLRLRGPSDLTADAFKSKLEVPSCEPCLEACEIC